MGVLSKDKSEETARSFPDKEELKKSLFKSQGGFCAICNTGIDEERLSDGSYVHLDHKQPFSKDGKSTKENAALTHASCNQSKGNKEY